jgi:pyruvyl transferase EpsO
MSTHQMNNTHTKLKHVIKDTITSYLPHHMENICIVDPPNHTNVGDSAIFAGELDFFRQHYSSAHLWFVDFNNYNKFYDKYINGASILAFHGGGNFGDIWPNHQLFRLMIMEEFPGIPKIQFPQSISFTSGGLLERTQRAISKQKDFILFVRDYKSLEFAKKHFECDSYLCPDMAFAIRPLKRAPSSTEYFCLLRTDKEILSEKTSQITSALSERSLSFLIDDWIGWEHSAWSTRDKFIKKLGDQHPQMTPLIKKPTLYIREKFAWARINHGIKLLSSGQFVITDRLHGHIISTLLELPHFVFDSLDGKVSAFHKAWLSDENNATFVHSIADFKDQLCFKQQGDHNRP